MTFDEMLDLLPGLRRLRSIQAPWCRTLMNRQPGECTWCGQKVAKGRSTWCGDECVLAFKLRCDQGTQRRIVTERDGGICRQCGRDTVAEENGFQTESEWRRPHETKESFEERRILLVERQFASGYARGRWREVDHIVPIIEGGGLCGPEGLRLLCGACHHEATTQLAGRRRALA